MSTPDEEVDAVELLLCRVPVTPLPPPPTTADDCIVFSPVKAEIKRIILLKEYVATRVK